MKRFIPSDFDLVDYDRELLKKQLDLETVEISLKRDHDKELEIQAEEGTPSIKPFYIRSVVKFNNEEGTFRRLQMELQKIAQEYGVNEEDIHMMFIEVSCSKKKLIETLQGKSYSKWNELEDMALTKDSESNEYRFLLKTKGYEEIIRRKKFLGI